MNFAGAIAVLATTVAAASCAAGQQALQPAWTWAAPERLASFALAESRGCLLLKSERGGLTSVDSRSGAVRGTAYIGPAARLVGVSTSGETWYAIQRDGVLALGLPELRLVWSRGLPPTTRPDLPRGDPEHLLVGSAADLVAGDLFLAEGTGTCGLLAPGTGTPRWSLRFAERVAALRVHAAEGRAALLWQENGAAWARIMDAQSAARADKALRLADGWPAWSTLTGAGLVTFSPGVLRVYGARAEAIEPSTFLLPAAVGPANLAVMEIAGRGEARAYFAVFPADEDLLAVDLLTQAVRWRTTLKVNSPAPAPVPSAPASIPQVHAEGECLVVITGDSLRIVDPRNGAVLDRVPLPSGARVAAHRVSPAGIDVICRNVSDDQLRLLRQKRSSSAAAPVERVLEASAGPTLLGFAWDGSRVLIIAPQRVVAFTLP